MQDGVILLHGIFRSSWSMWSMSMYLARRGGYRTLNLDYDSRDYPLEELADHIHPKIEKFMQKTEGQIHFVGHSMGGLLIRTYINRYRPQKLGRVVMIGTPNKGSEVADKLKNFWLFHKLYGPAGQQLLTDQTSFFSIFGNVNYELGIIAGNGTIDPIGSYLIGGENDGKVSVESTKLNGMKAHRVVPVSHAFLPGSGLVEKLTLEFLQTGQMSS